MPTIHDVSMNQDYLVPRAGVLMPAHTRAYFPLPTVNCESRNSDLTNRLDHELHVMNRLAIN